MKEVVRNVKVFAETSAGDTHIILDVSGQRVRIMRFHMGQELLELLRDGLWMESLRRWKPPKTVANRANRNIQKQKQKLLETVDDYLEVLSNESDINACL